MNKRTKKKIRKRLGCFRYKAYHEKLMRFAEGYYKWIRSGAPVGLIESVTIQRGSNAKKEAAMLSELRVWNYLSVKGLSNTEIAGFRGNMVLERSRMGQIHQNRG